VRYIFTRSMIVSLDMEKASFDWALFGGKPSDGAPSPRLQSQVPTADVARQSSDHYCSTCVSLQSDGCQDDLSSDLRVPKSDAQKYLFLV
jgi:hypothetical protein